jgi:hypothetical protein
MPVIIEEVTTEALKPVAAPKSAQPATEVPADTKVNVRKALAELRRSEARRERLRAD